MDKFKKQISYWQSSAERNWKTAVGLFKLKHYDACLFFCHLTLEKELKGLVVKRTRQAAPYLHNLERLSQLAKIDWSDEQIFNLRVITTFNIAARYDEDKFSFYKKCSKEYTAKFLQITQELYLCLKKEYLKN